VLDDHRQRSVNDGRFIGAPVRVPLQILHPAQLRASQD
jgi:hypothetical protein